ncbi:MAG: hypothetical protein QXS29_06000 [Nitrososphaeria archaeon]
MENGNSRFPDFVSIYPEPKLIQVYKLTDGFNLPWLPSLPGSEKEVPNAKNSDNNFGKAQDFNQNFDKNFSPSTPSYSDHVNHVNLVKICQSCMYQNNVVQKLPTLPTLLAPGQHETNIKNGVGKFFWCRLFLHITYTSF